MGNLTIEIIGDHQIVSREDLDDMAMRGDKEALDALQTGRRIVRSSGRGPIAKIAFDKVVLQGTGYAKERHVLSGFARDMPDHAAFKSDMEFITAMLDTMLFTHSREVVAGYG
jgi:hypothetical protein